MKIVFLFCCIALSSAMENVHNIMYTTLAEVSPCILRLNGSRSFGCSSQRGGSVGVIHLAYNQSSLDWVVNNATRDAYVVVMNLPMFTMANLKKLNASEKVHGILLVQKERQPLLKEFSPESQCPNKYVGLGDAAHHYSSSSCPATAPWNTYGNEIAMQFWRMPMFFTEEKSTIDEVEKCFNESNLPLNNQANRALCALELLSYMYASGDSNKCIRRSYPRYNINPVRLCYEMTGENIHAPVISYDSFKKVRDESYIFVTARLDSTSLFLGRAPGALSTATSIVALLLTSNVLNRLLKDNSSTATKNVLFALFNGEAYDYLGSQRTVFDMERGQFPNPRDALKLEDVGLFLELSQLFNNGGTMSYHTYANMTSGRVALINDFDKSFRKFVSEFNYKLSIAEWPSNDARFPPSSYQSFLARKAVPGFVLGSYNERFQNRYYHSLYDNADSLDYKFANGSTIASDSLTAFIAQFSTVLGHTLYSMMMPPGAEGSRDVSVTYSEADDILNCFLETSACDFFARIHGSPLVDLALDYYISVSPAYSQTTMMARQALLYFMGRNVSASSAEECDGKHEQNQRYSYLWVSAESRCLESNVNSSLVVSPAFTEEEYELNEGIYSSWTESAMTAARVRKFYKPSVEYEWLAFVMGCAVLSASFLIVFWVRRNSQELFNFPQLIATSSI